MSTGGRIYKVWHCWPAIAVLALTACQSASISQASADRVNQQAKAPAEGGLPASAVTGPRDYRLGPLDLIDIDVFGSPEFTRSVRVSASGEVSIPLIGIVKAEGKTIVELQKDIAELLKQKYLEDPHVTAFVKEYQSQRVTVEGAVKTPGVVALTGRTSLLQVVAMSGGLDREANLGAVVIYRVIEDRRRAAVFDFRKIRNGELIDPEVLGGDVVVCDYSGFRSSLKDFLQSSPLLAVFITAL